MRASEIGLDEFDPFGASAVERVVATTEAQREVWLADALGSEASLAFNESLWLSLRGSLDVQALQHALSGVVARHDALRATIGPDGTQMLIGAPAPRELALTDLSALGAGQREAAIATAAAAAARTPFDLAQGPLWRAALYRLAPDHHALLLSAHHIVCDGWSWGVIVDDLGACYRERLGGERADVHTELYSDYVQWEAVDATSPSRAQHEQFWLARYAGGSLPVLDLPTDRARAALRSFASRRIDHPIDAALVTELRRTAGLHGASLFAVLLAAFAALLQRLAGQDDVVIGVPAAGQLASGLRRVVGHCVNLLPIRIQGSAQQPAAAFLRQASTALLDAFEHQTVTYGSLLKHLPVQRDPSRPPLVSVMFNLDQALRVAPEAFPGLQVEASGLPRHFENFELFVNVAQIDGGLRLECQYNTALFDGASIERWLAAYETLLRSMADGLERPLADLDWLAPEQRAALFALQPAPHALPVPALMHAAVDAQCARSPDAIALRFGDEAITYRDLDRRAAVLAHALRARGIVRGDRVGLCLPRGIEMVVALLAVLRTGAAYVPLDPGFPAARLADCAEDASLALLLTRTSVDAAPKAWRPDARQRTLHLDQGDAAPAESMPAPIDSGAGPDDAAYVIYTSGSTGRPKGVAVPHRAVANFLASMRREPGLAATDRLAAVTTLSFDIAVLELLLPLTVGAEVVIVPREIAIDGQALAALLQAHQVGAMQATPTLWRLLLDAGWQGAPHFKALIGGEACPLELAQELLDRVGELWNLYGPTETTIWSTCGRLVLPLHNVSIGRPIANTTVWVLDEGLRACPVGVPGELCIGGAGVAIGYLGATAALTAERFVADPFAPGHRLYRTGDRGRWRNDGTLEHLGRLDFQVKVRGYRVELGEIEAACSEVAGVAQCVLLAREDQPGDTRLVAYLTAQDGAAFDEQALRTHLRAKLPDYMQPQHVVRLEQLPLLPNGKVDRKSLPAPDRTHAAAARDRVAPRDELERSVLAAVEAILNLPHLSVHDDFFVLGGHSLLAARLTARLNRDLGVQLAMRSVFEAPTAQGLAAAVRAARAVSAPPREPLVHDPQCREAPLTPMQERVRFVETLLPGRVVYNTPSAHRLSGPMDAAKFKLALERIVERQPTLRTYIARDDSGHDFVQRIAERVDFELPLQDLRSWPEGDREAELMRRMQAIVDTPIDLDAPPLFRVALYRLADEEHAFLFMPHHIMWDGWSFDLLYDELAAIYGQLTGGAEPALPALPVTYADHALWYRRWLQGDEARAELQHWRQRFASAPPPRPLHPDRPRQAGMSGQGGAEWIRIDRVLAERLRSIAAEIGVTLNMLTMAAFAAVMAEAIEAGSVVVGVPLRGRLMHEVEPVMGFFNNTLPLHLAVDRSLGVADYLHSIRSALLDLFSHQAIAFEVLAADGEISRQLHHAGLYQVMFSFQDARERRRKWGPLQQQAILILQKGATEDLGLWLMEVPGGLEGAFVYNADLYDVPTAQALRTRYLELLHRLAENPSLSLGQWCDPRGSASAAYLHRLAPLTGDAATVHGDSPADLALPPPWQRSDDEQALAQIWAAALDIDASRIGPEHSFFDLGGNSLMAMSMLAEIEQRLGATLPPAALIETPAIPQLARLLRAPRKPNSLILLRRGAQRTPIFLVHDADGATLLYRSLAYRLDAGHPIYGLQPLVNEQGLPAHTRIEEMAAHYVRQIHSVQPEGPYLLGGLCAGGVIAFEVALQLQRAGEPVAMVALIDAADVSMAEPAARVAMRRLRRVAAALTSHADLPLARRLASSVATLARKARAYLSYEASSRLERMRTARSVSTLRVSHAAGSEPPREALGVTLRNVYDHAAAEYAQRGKLAGNVVLFRASRGSGSMADRPLAEMVDDPTLGWQRHVLAPIRCVDISGGHSSMLHEPNVDELAHTMQSFVDEVCPQC